MDSIELLDWPSFISDDCVPEKVHRVKNPPAEPLSESLSEPLSESLSEEWNARGDPFLKNVRADIASAKKNFDGKSCVCDMVSKVIQADSFGVSS